MPLDLQPYSVAFLTRGAGAFAYTYLGPPELAPGQLCAVLFRGELELGMVTSTDAPAEPGQHLLHLWPVSVSGLPHWGRLLLDLCELATAAPHEVAGLLLFDAPSHGLKWHFAIHEAEALERDRLALLGLLTGELTPSKRRAFARVGGWEELVEQAEAGVLELSVSVAGTPSCTRANPRWRGIYALEPRSAKLLGLPPHTELTLPGSYLAGLLAPADFSDRATKVPRVGGAEPEGPARKPQEAAQLEWHSLRWPSNWALLRRWPLLADLPLRRAQASWQALRAPGGLAAELGAAIHAAQRVLVIAPQNWMLDRIWPALAPWAWRVHRFRSEAGASAAAHLLGRLESGGGHVVAGGPGAWKLAAYAALDKVILLDPSHPQYAPERHPSLDPRLAAFLALAAHAGQREPRKARKRGRSTGVCLDVIEMGLSGWDGSTHLAHVALLDPFEQPAMPPAPASRADTDPLPLVLRQPGRRRLICFNRLGSGRGLRCVECSQAVGCPRCGSLRIAFSADEAAYRCPQCGFEARELRCPTCGLGMLAAQLPGLEAVGRRKGDYILHSPQGSKRAHPEWQSVLGTTALLEPLSGFWPQEVVYIHAEARLFLLDDWTGAMDMAARLTGLYANPELEFTYVVSARLRGQLGDSLTAAQLQQQWQSDRRLRRLAGLPPYGGLLILRISATSRKAAEGAREQVGRFFQSHAQTSLLRLGQPYREGATFRLPGVAVNPGATLAELEELRWRVHDMGAGLRIRSLYDPWA